MEGIRGGQWEIKPNAAIVKAKFVGRPGIDHVSIAEQTVQGDAIEVVVKTGKIVERGTGGALVIQPAEAHVLLVGDSVVHTDLVIVIERGLRGRTAHQSKSRERIQSRPG